MFVVCGRTLWHIVQVARSDDSPQTSLSACRGGVAPPPPTSVTGPGAVVLPLTAATAVARAIAVAAPPRATQVVRRRRRLFCSELNDAPRSATAAVLECDRTR